MALPEFTHKDYFPEQHAHQSLTIFFSNGLIAYAVRNRTSGVVLMVKAYVNANKLAALKFWENIKAKDGVLSSMDFGEVTLLIHPPFYTLIPDQYYEVGSEKAYIQSVFDLPLSHVDLIVEPLPTLGIQMLYVIDQKLNVTLLNAYPQLVHQCALTRLITFAAKHTQQHKSPFTAIVDLNNDKFVYCLFAQQKLLFCNQYNCATAEDIIYYLFRVNQTLQVSAHDLTITCTGYNHFKEDILKLLATYFQQLQPSHSFFEYHADLTKTDFPIDNLSLLLTL
jgi:hypothetical protein